MSRFTQSALGTAALAALVAAGAAFAQNDPAPADPAGPPVMDPDEPAADEPGLLDEAGAAPLDASPFIELQAANELLATDFIGKPVFNTAAETLGSIDNLIVSVEGQLTGIVVGVGGFLGIGEKKVAIAISAVQLMSTDEGEMRFIVDLGRTAIENAPDFRTFEQQQADIGSGEPAGGEAPADDAGNADGETPAEDAGDESSE
ncbi:MAG: PRC-barrel domain-containing protein [Bauldia sp.]|nr:PRC-barrel domain-containing protein [Bauldia sp.]